MKQEKIGKEAYDEALKDIEKDKKNEIKNIIKATLKKKLEIDAQISKLQKKKKILNQDLENFKKGRLDLIEERQKIDKLAKEVSVVKVEKIIEKHYHHDRPWFEPYKITWVEPYVYVDSGTIDYSNTAISTITTCGSTMNSDFNAVGSDFHFYSSGTYDINDKIINL